jgi:hypothetical protein
VVNSLQLRDVIFPLKPCQVCDLISCEVYLRGWPIGKGVPLKTPSGRRTWLGSFRVGLHVRDQGTTTASVHVSVTILYLAMSSE